eukprot:6489517-Amphidinium_carterae.1
MHGNDCPHECPSFNARVRACTSQQLDIEHCWGRPLPKDLLKMVRSWCLMLACGIMWLAQQQRWLRNFEP